MEKIQMHGVPETMLQTLYARAAYSKGREAKFYDDKACVMSMRRITRSIMAQWGPH